ncbi:MAG: shikimate kinase [Deltaproteobacteria bacterium]|nr:shikimate kinase [Deltaproteobacteria bacterium]
MGSARRSDRSLLLTGPMGAGKTRVGRLLARRLDWPFVDTDERIEAVSGMRIPEIFAREGEAGFRSRERRVLSGLPERDSVVALGGGAVVSPENREILRGKGTLVWLDASAATLAARLSGGNGAGSGSGAEDDRPLLAGLDPPAREARLEQIRVERRAAYSEAPYRVATDGRSAEQVCDAVLSALGWEDAA